MRTIASLPVHSEDEHAIVALLTNKSVKQVTLIQDQLVQLFGNAIWLQQPPSLHITLIEIICDTAYTQQSRQQHFKQWYENYNQTVKEVLAGFSPFEITFNELVVSQRAIIIKAADTKLFNDIRQSLLSKITLPAGTRLPPDITHCSLARFNKTVGLEDAVRLTKDIAVNFIEHIEEFALVKDLGPPDFNGLPMQTYPLKPKLPP